MTIDRKASRLSLDNSYVQRAEHYQSHQVEKLVNGFYRSDLPTQKISHYSNGQLSGDELSSHLDSYYFTSKKRQALNEASTSERVSGWDVNSIRSDFPVLHQKLNGSPLIWFDTAATSQKPKVVIDTLNHYYSCDNANVHRAGHALGRRATDAFEGARDKVRTFLGASLSEEILFLRGTTEAINLIAKSYGPQHLRSHDEILITELEHHSNIVPWIMLAQEMGARLRVAPINEQGEIIIEEYERLLSPRTRIVSMTHASNALGTIVPVQKMIQMARRSSECIVIVDGAQAVPHFKVDVQALDADFYAFSGHKLLGPTGIGVLYGKKSILEKMPPWQGGGSMIKEVHFDRVIYNDLPYKYEAGTANIGGAIGLGAAIDYMQKIGFEAIERYENGLLAYAMKKMSMIRGLKVIGTAKEKVAVISFIMEGRDVKQVGEALDKAGIAVRAGHHCAQPALRHFGLDSTVRASFTFFNTINEIDTMIDVLKRCSQ